MNSIKLNKLIQLNSINKLNQIKSINFSIMIQSGSKYETFFCCWLFNFNSMKWNQSSCEWDAGVAANALTIGGVVEYQIDSIDSHFPMWMHLFFSL